MKFINTSSLIIFTMTFLFLACEKPLYKKERKNIYRDEFDNQGNWLLIADSNYNKSDAKIAEGKLSLYVFDIGSAVAKFNYSNYIGNNSDIETICFEMKIEELKHSTYTNTWIYNNEGTSYLYIYYKNYVIGIFETISFNNSVINICLDMRKKKEGLRAYINNNKKLSPSFFLDDTDTIGNIIEFGIQSNASSVGIITEKKIIIDYIEIYTVD